MQKKELPAAITALGFNLGRDLKGVLNRMVLIRGKSSLGISDLFHIEGCPSCTEEKSKALIKEHFGSRSWPIHEVPFDMCEGFAFSTEGEGEKYLVIGEVKEHKMLCVCIIVLRPGTKIT